MVIITFVVLSICLGGIISTIWLSIWLYIETNKNNKGE